MHSIHAKTSLTQYAGPGDCQRTISVAAIQIYPAETHQPIFVCTRKGRTTECMFGSVRFLQALRDIFYRRESGVWGTDAAWSIHPPLNPAGVRLIESGRNYRSTTCPLHGLPARLHYRPRASPSNSFSMDAKSRWTGPTHSRRSSRAGRDMTCSGFVAGAQSAFPSDRPARHCGVYRDPMPFEWSLHAALGRLGTFA